MMLASSTIYYGEERLVNGIWCVSRPKWIFLWKQYPKVKKCDGLSDRVTDRQTVRQTDRQTDRQAGRLLTGSTTVYFFQSVCLYRTVDSKGAVGITTVWIMIRASLRMLYLCRYGSWRCMHKKKTSVHRTLIRWTSVRDLPSFHMAKLFYTHSWNWR